MPDHTSTNTVTTTGRTAEDDSAVQNRADSAAPQGYPVTSVSVTSTANPGPHNPDAHGPQHDATQDTVAQKLEDEADTGPENRY